MAAEEDNGWGSLTCGEQVLYLSQACDSFIYRRFKVLGGMLHDYRWRFLIIPILLMLPMIGGTTQLSRLTEDDPAKLYVPENTKAEQDDVKIKASFGLGERIAHVYATTNPDGSNILTTENVLTLYDAWDNVTTFTSAHAGETFNLSGVCQLIRGQCQKQTILAFYDYNRTQIAELSDAQLWQTIVDANYTTTEEDGLTVTLGAVASYNTDGTVLSTKFNMIIEQKVEDDSNGDGNAEKPKAWELELSQVIRSRSWGSLSLYSDSFGELNEVASAAFGGDLTLLPVGYILLVMYATAVLSRNSSVHSHGTLALVSFFAVCIAILASFGLGLWFQIPFSSMIFTLAFLLLGLGTDDTFVLVAAFQHKDVLHLEPRERVAEAMARAGSSITVTSLTDLVAFLAGSYCSIPVVRAFCQYAAIGVTLDFFLQVTFFSVAMYMSGTREEQQKIDWLCCFLSSKPDSKLVGKGDFSRDQPEMLTVFLETIYAPRLISRGGKVVGVALGLSLLGLGIWACTRVTVDFEYEWFIPDDSYFQDTLAVRKRYYGAREVPVAMYTFSGNYSSSLSQSQYSKMTTALENNDMLVEDSCVNWWPDFIAFAESNASTAMTTFDGERIVGSTVFDQTFLNFYNDDAGSPYRNYLTVSNDVLELTEIPCRDDTARRDMTYRTEQMDRMREIAEICWSLGAVALGPAYWVQDAHKIFLREIVINLACALAGVFFITTLMLGSLVPSLIVTFLLVVIDVEVLGSIYLSGDYFNTVTGINLVLAVGLSVDAVAHITHAFLAHDGTGDERARRALVEIGRSVFNGAVSTMIVLLPLVGARTYVFQVFFRTFMAIIGYSAFNGLVVLPIILSVVVPSSYNTRRSRLGLEEHGRNNKSSVDSQKHPTIFNASPVFNASQMSQPPRAVSSF
eukprot:m.299671 g.299671  ORF g.299671 m.299671 type:complete len:908 (-) comp16299_c0_seq2:26-2749(-)